MALTSSHGHDPPRGLWAEGLTKIYGKGETAVQALDNVQLRAEPGQVIGIVGPSGSGKTTLLAILGALTLPTSGSVAVGDTDVTALDARQRAAFRRTRLGFVFQEHNLLPYLTAVDNVALMGPLSGRSSRHHRQRAMALLAELGIGHRTGHLPHELSGGERQRVALARALFHDPPLLLLDEPTSRLDSTTGDRLMRELAQQGRTRSKIVLFATHDPRACHHADRVLELVDGRTR